MTQLRRGRLQVAHHATATRMMGISLYCSSFEAYFIKVVQSIADRRVDSIELAKYTEGIRVVIKEIIFKLKTVSMILIYILKYLHLI